MSKRSNGAMRGGRGGDSGDVRSGGFGSPRTIEVTGVRQRFHPGWSPQVDESYRPDAPAERCLAEAPLKNGVMVVIELDRFIMDAPPEMKVVHLNGDYWDCRKENLSLVAKPPRPLRAGARGMEIALASAAGELRGPFHPGWSPQVDEADDPEVPRMRIQGHVPLRNGALVVMQVDRLIMDAAPEMKVVHLNGDDRDCRRENLALVAKPPRAICVGETGLDLAVDKCNGRAQLGFSRVEADLWIPDEAA